MNKTIYSILMAGLGDYSYKDYNCHSKEGFFTGRGYVFEDMVMEEMRKNNVIIDRCTQFKNGADFIIRNTPNGDSALQLKCCRNPQNAVMHLLKDGVERYPNQIPLVPKNQGQAVAKGLAEKGVNAKVMESSVSFQDVDKHTFRGFTSFVDDLKRNVAPSSKLALMASGFVAVGSMIYEVVTDKNDDGLGNKIKRAVKPTIKRSVISGIATFSASLLMKAAYCQYLRPVRI